MEPEPQQGADYDGTKHVIVNINKCTKPDFVLAS